MAVDPVRAQRVFRVVSEAEPADRAAALERECDGDAELRRFVEALLRAHEDAAELPTAAAATGGFASAIEPGTVFGGRYKLREKLGEGGMGVVFAAEQSEPVKRPVALKVIHTGLDSCQLLARFDQERQALALMDHPNIAKVFDAGMDDAGRPYFAMELVKGLPITKYCDDAKLSARQRIELFIPVCQAVQHAHQKGVIHRDLKPSNVLVGMYDGVAIPKVIDFGVAKATGPRLTDESVYTEIGSLIGTLEYMSPEQAEQNNLDIDTRCDVYALGVVLYELLTGAVPFSRKDLEKAGLAEMLRVIKEVEPQKPSTRVSRSGSLPSIAAARHTEPKALTSLLRGELDWIVMKALEKDRNRRYETANSLAMDVQRYLADEPVHACPPSAGYRFKKLVRRNKGKVTAVGLVVIALLGGITGTTWGLVQATHATAAARLAQDDAVDKRKKAEAASRLADDKRKEAEAATRLAIERARAAQSIAMVLFEETERLAPVGDFGLFMATIFERRTARETRDLFRMYVTSEDPREISRGLKEVYDWFGHIALKSGRLSLARDYFERAKGEAENLAKVDQIERNQAVLIDALVQLGNVALRQGEAVPARQFFNEASELNQRFLQADPKMNRSLSILVGLGEVDEFDGNFAAAVARYQFAAEAERKQSNDVRFPESFRQVQTLISRTSLMPKVMENPNNALMLTPNQCMESLDRRLHLLAIRGDSSGLKATAAAYDDVLNRNTGDLIIQFSAARAWSETWRATNADRKLSAAEQTKLLIDCKTNALERMRGAVKLGYADTVTLANDLYLTELRKWPEYVEILAGARVNAAERAAARESKSRAMLGANLLQQKKWAEAEPILRECLTIHEKQQPDVWATFNTQSLLGGALLGQKRYMEAEPLLLRGYDGMKQREDKILPQERPRLTEALERLVQLYDATNKPNEAAKWRKELKKTREKP